MKVAVVAEYYPRRSDPTLGIWAHRQALATRDAGADAEVFVLHRPRSLALLRQPLLARLDGIRVNYVPFLAPPRPRSYARWGAWAAPTLAAALRARGPFDLVHAHYAVPAGDAVRRARVKVPVVISVHGGDVLGVAERWRGGREAVGDAFGAARLVLANSAGIAERSRALGAREVRVVHLGTDVPAEVSTGTTLVSVGNLIARKRHADVLRALALLDAPPRYVIVGDGPERPALERLADGLEVEFRGRLAPAEALRVARGAGAFVLPSVEEAFGVAYIEAMAAGVPAIGTRGEPGPEEIAASGGGMTLVPPGDADEIAASGGGMTLVPPGDAEEIAASGGGMTLVPPGDAEEIAASGGGMTLVPPGDAEEIAASGGGMTLVPPGDAEALAKAIRMVLADRAALGAAARANVEANFTWAQCGRATVAAYEEALR